MNLEQSNTQISPWWGILIIFSIGFPSFFLLKEPTNKLDNYGQIPAFSLTDQEGRSQNNLNYIGQIVILNFIFTRCKDVCPTLSSQMSRMQTDFQKSLQRDQLQLLSLTVDPYYDSPAVLKEYSELFSTNSDHWHFLTGEKENLPVLIQNFQQAYEVTNPNQEVPSILHSEKFILIDQEGFIRGFFSNTKEGREKLFDAIKVL
jgi:cytochrome oxidase Cu insertion factor (SCO1/SenC/PrrC family)